MKFFTVGLSYWYTFISCFRFVNYLYIDRCDRCHLYYFLRCNVSITRHLWILVRKQATPPRLSTNRLYQVNAYRIRIERTGRDFLFLEMRPIRRGWECKVLYDSIKIILQFDRFGADTVHSPKNGRGVAQLQSAVLGNDVFDNHEHVLEYCILNGQPMISDSKFTKPVFQL